MLSREGGEQAQSSHLVGHDGAKLYFGDHDGSQPSLGGH